MKLLLLCCPNVHEEERSMEVVLMVFIGLQIYHSGFGLGGGGPRSTPTLTKDLNG